MRLTFAKAEGAGNDFICIDRRAGGPARDWGVLARALCCRHTGIGADGILLLGPPRLADADATLYIYNADGSEAAMCGNGVRCAAQYLAAHGAGPGPLALDTRSAGRRTLYRQGKGMWRVEMGRFSARAADLPAVGLGAGPLVRCTLAAAQQSWDCTCLSMGNPHCVVPWPQGPLPHGARLAALGQALEHHPAFPQGCNVEFVQPLGSRQLRVRVWERGAGATLACGTGACAAAVAMVLRGACRRGVPVTVQMPGGELEVTVQPDDTVWLTGPARLVYEGSVVV